MASVLDTQEARTYISSSEMPFFRRVVGDENNVITLAGAGVADDGVIKSDVFGINEAGRHVAVIPPNAGGSLKVECADSVIPEVDSVTPDGGNTGDATVVATVDHNTPLGDYVLTCIDDSTPNSEIWKLERGSNVLSETITTGVEYSSEQITLTITAGGTAHANDDFFTIAVIFNDVLYGAADGKVSQTVSGDPRFKAKEYGQAANAVIEVVNI